MPLPSPRNKEKRGDFVNRCMADLSKKGEFKDAKQRAAVCYDAFKKAEAKASITVGEGDDQILYLTESADAAERFGGKKRSDLKDSAFLDPKRRSFPVVTCKDVKDAVSSWGRYKGSMTFDQFKAKLTNRAKRLGCAGSLPKSWTKE
jgi:hypothetical protein